MNGAYLHLLMNHIPVVGMPLVFLLLAAGLIRKSQELNRAAFVGAILMAIITIPVIKTGGPAAHVLFTYPGVAVERAAIHEHAEAADYAFTAVEIVGALSLIAFGWSWRSGAVPTWFSLILLLGTLMTSVIMGRVAHLGGLIRHPEISSEAKPPLAVTTPDTSEPEDHS